MRYLVCYDSPSNRRRARVAKALERYGFRIQYSVFECELTRWLLRDLIQALSANIDPGEDNVRIYPLCESCSGKIRIIGIPDPYAFEENTLLL